MNMLPFLAYLVLLFLGCAVAFLYRRVGMLDDELSRESKARHDFWNEWLKEKYDVRSALSAAGVRKKPGMPERWVKED